MKYALLVVLLGCGTTTPNGYCESDDECGPSDRCWLERELDSHLQKPDREVIPINRCWPRSEEGDWCVEGEDWCAEGLTCEALDCGGGKTCGRGTCERASTAS
jgi:hypothetical protein